MVSNFFAKILCLLFVINLFFLRPAALGQAFTPVAIAIAIFLFVASILAMRKNKIFLLHKPPRHIYLPLMILLLYYFYEILISIVFGASKLEFVFKEIAVIFCICMIYGVLLSNSNFNKLFFSQFSGVLAILGWSCVITLIISSFVDMETLYWAKIDVEGYTQATEFETGGIYFPFSMLYASFNSYDTSLFRFSGFFREAGIFQAFCCFAIAYETFIAARRWVLIGCAAGAIASFSTSGIAILGVTIFLVSLVRRPQKSPVKILVLPILLSLGAVAFLYAPAIGYYAKADTHGGSLSDRSTAMNNALTDLGDNPLGTGLYSNSAENASITMIAAISSIGLLGFSLQVLYMSGYAMGKGRATVQRMTCCAPILFTALFGQPLLSAPLVLLIPFCYISRQDVEKSASRRSIWWTKKLMFRAHS